MNAPNEQARLMGAQDDAHRLDAATLAATGGRPGLDRPFTLLILALGGEGGGVLADWVVDTAIGAGLPVQATSVPGVAQRTGATSYYIEMMAAPGTRQPVFCLAPLAGRIDLLVSSELLETARAVERGMTDPRLTTLVSSTSRFLTVAEKQQMGDGRYDAERAVAAMQAMSHEAVLFDMAAETQAARTVISAVMFGALVGTGRLPLSREACEATIRAGGRGAEASLDGFARGVAAVQRARSTRDTLAALAREAATPQPTPTAGAPTAAAPQPAAHAAAPSAAPTTASTRAAQPLTELLALGTARMREYQDADYADLYSARMRRIVDAERAAGSVDLPVSRTAARFLALWMAYEDVIRVADLKTRPERLERVRREVGARDGEPVVVREFLKPGVEEIAAILPPALAARVMAWARRRKLQALSEGMQVATTSVRGSLMLRTLAWLRPLRRRSSRFIEEQAQIERWIGALLKVLSGSGPGAATAGSDTQGLARLALEIAECPRVLKGYGETHARGRRSFAAMMDTLIDRPLGAGESATDRAAALRRAREAALADPEGRSLAQALGLPPPAPKVHPIRFVEMKRKGASGA